jgi:hypothetical protein
MTKGNTRPGELGEPFLSEIGRIAKDSTFIERTLEWMILVFLQLDASIGEAITQDLRLDMHAKIKLVRELAKRRDFPNMRRLNRLLQRVDEVRKLRNQMVHAHWWVRGDTSDPVELEFAGAREEITLAELRSLVRRTERVSNDLWSFMSDNKMFAAGVKFSSRF